MRLAFLACIVIGSIAALYFTESSLSEWIHDNRGTFVTGGLSDAPHPSDIVTVTVHDKNGRLVSVQKAHNIVTSNGAVWFCFKQNICTSQITGTTPALSGSTSTTWWIQFISGTANTNEPTAADCTSPSGGGAISGQVSGGRCVTNFGAAPAQYQTGGSIITVGTTTNQLQNSGASVDTTNKYVQATPVTNTCSVINDGTAPSSGTCQFSVTSGTFTNQSGGALTVNGLALASGTISSTVAGPLIIFESTITAVTLQAGDTISVTWTVTT